jgi:Flp pilus assembly CpaE family ATPase
LKDVSGQHLYAVQKALTRVTDKLHMIAGPHQAVMPMQVKAQDVLEVIRLCRRLAEWTLLDVPCTYDDLYFKILAAADRVIMVAERALDSRSQADLRPAVP